MDKQSIDQLLSDPQTQLSTYKAFLREAPIALIAVELASKRIAIWNAYAVTLFGYTEDEAIGQDLSLIIAAEVMNMFSHNKSIDTYALSNAAGDKPTPKGMGGDRTFWAKTKTGKKIYIEIRIFPLEAKEMMMIGAAIEDVSEQHKQLAQLKKQDEQLRKVKASLERALSDTQRLQQETAEENIDLLEAQSTARQQDRFLIAQVGIVGASFAFLFLLVCGPMVIEGFTRKRFSSSTNTRADQTANVVGSLVLTLGGAFSASAIFGGSNRSDNSGKKKEAQTRSAITPNTYPQSPALPDPSAGAIAPEPSAVAPPSFSPSGDEERSMGGGEM